MNDLLWLLVRFNSTPPHILLAINLHDRQMIPKWLAFSKNDITMIDVTVYPNDTINSFIKKETSLR